MTTVVWSYGQSYTEGTYWSYGQLKIFQPYTAGVTTIEVSEDATIAEEVIVDKAFTVKEDVQVGEEILRDKTFSVEDCVSISEEVLRDKNFLIEDQVSVTENLEMTKSLTICEYLQIDENVGFPSKDLIVSEDIVVCESVAVVGEEKEFAESLTIIVSKPPSGKYAVKGIWFVNGSLQFRVSPESQAVVTSFLAGYASQTIRGVKNIYCDEEGNIFYETDDKPHQYIASGPPKGYKKVVNVYYDPETGKIVFEYRGDGI